MIVEKKDSISANYMYELVIEVKRTYGQELLSVADTYHLSETIYAKTGKKVSPTTLQRLLGLVKSKSRPFCSTLNILAEYIGYKDWERFCDIQKEIASNDISGKRFIPDYSALVLLNICLKNKSIQSIVDFLDMLYPKYEQNHFFSNNKITTAVSNLLGKYARQDRELARELLPMLAKTERGREYFFESFVDLDYLDDYLIDAFDFYDKHSDGTSTAKGRTEFVFSNSLRLLNHFEKDDMPAFKNLAENVFSTLHPRDITNETCLHLNPVARYSAFWLLYQYVEKKLSDNIIDFFLHRMQEMIDQRTLPNMILMHSLYALHYSKLFEHLITFYENNFSWFSKEPWNDESTTLVNSYAFHAYNVMGKEFPVSSTSLFLPKKDPYFLCSAHYVSQKVEKLTASLKLPVVK